MTRTIRKKLIDEDLKLSDEFDEEFLDKIEKEYEKQSGSESDPRRPPRARADQGQMSPVQSSSAPNSSAPAFSIDDFEDIESTPATAPSGNETRTEGRSSSPEASSPGQEPLQGKRRREIAPNKMLMIGAASVFVLVLAGLLIVKWMKSPEQLSKVMTKIRHPIAFPLRQDQMELLILAGSQQEKELVTMGLELTYRTRAGSESPENEDILMRDTVYRFLLGEQPDKNIEKDWKGIIEDNLANYLRASFPKSGLQSVRLSSFERL